MSGTFLTQCLHCGTMDQVPAERRGQAVTCVNCQRTFVAEEFASPRAERAKSIWDAPEGEPRAGGGQWPVWSVLMLLFLPVLLVGSLLTPYAIIILPLLLAAAGGLLALWTRKKSGPRS